MDKLTKRVGDAFLNAKGFEFPKALMGGLVQPPYPRPDEPENGQAWADSMHRDVAFWCAVVGLPVLAAAQGRAKVKDENRLSVKPGYWKQAEPPGRELRQALLERFRQQQAGPDGKGEE
jgi:hypothetical protein